MRLTVASEALPWPVNLSQTYDCFSAAPSFALRNVRIDHLSPVHDGRRGNVQAVLGKREADRGPDAAAGGCHQHRIADAGVRDTHDLDWATLRAVPEMLQTSYGSLTTGLDARPGRSPS